MLGPMLSLQYSLPLFSEELYSSPDPYLTPFFSHLNILLHHPKACEEQPLLPDMLFRRLLSTLVYCLCYEYTVYLATIPFHACCLFREVTLHIQTVNRLDMKTISVEGQNLLGDEGELIAHSFDYKMHVVS